MTEDLLEYPKLMERALRGVVRNALSIAAQHGLPGLHHFYIAFRTGAPGVSIPDQLRAQYPEEMTIVLENQFWDLEVADDRFSVTLSFNRTPQHLVIPFEAVVSFVDPSVKFGLQFGAQPDSAEAPPSETSEPPAETGPADAETPQDGDTSEGGEVVTLDSFRKK